MDSVAILECLLQEVFLSTGYKSCDECDHALLLYLHAYIRSDATRALHDRGGGNVMDPARGPCCHRHPAA